jgi:hypothetical protein
MNSSLKESIVYQSDCTIVKRPDPTQREPVQTIDFKFLSETTLLLEILLGKELGTAGREVFHLWLLC